VQQWRSAASTPTSFFHPIKRAARIEHALFRRRIFVCLFLSGTGKRGSLICDQEFPVPLSREFCEKPRNRLSFLRLDHRSQVRNEKIPCIFPDDQGINGGEQFAADCVIHHPVRLIVAFAENRVKSARVRAIHDLRMDRRTAPIGAERWNPPNVIRSRFQWVLLEPTVSHPQLMAAV